MIAIETDVNVDPNYSSGMALLADAQRGIIEAQHATQARRVAMLEETDPALVEARRRAEQQAREALAAVQQQQQTLSQYVATRPATSAEALTRGREAQRLRGELESLQHADEQQAAFEQAAQRVEQAIDGAILRHRREAQGKVEQLIQTYQGRVAEHDRQRIELVNEANGAVDQARRELQRWL